MNTQSNQQNNMNITDLSIDILHIINQNTKYIRTYNKVVENLTCGFKNMEEGGWIWDGFFPDGSTSSWPVRSIKPNQIDCWTFLGFPEKEEFVWNNEPPTFEERQNMRRID